MAKPPANSGGKHAGRTAKGHFLPGHSGNPKGRTLGSRNRASLAVDALLQGEARKLTRQAIKLALGGDTTALKICLDRICPPPKDRPIAFALPAVSEVADHPPAVAAVLAAVAIGELTPAEGGAVTAMLEQHRRSLETAELEARIRALEEGYEPVSSR